MRGPESGSPASSGEPDEDSIRKARPVAGRTVADGVSGEREMLSARVAGTLAAAGIPSAKLGARRWARLTGPERELYFWMLRRFATRGRPSNAELRRAAARLALDAEPALRALAREDLVQLDRAGEIAVAYPFSGRPTAHVVRFPGGHEAYAMCAIDALGIAPMLEQSIAIASRDPISGQEVAVQVAPSSDAHWSPASSVVVAGAIAGQDDSCESCCPVVNFFASRDTAERWLARHPEVRGRVITMREATLVGRAVFGDVLEQARRLPGGSGREVARPSLERVIRGRRTASRRR